MMITEIQWRVILQEMVNYLERRYDIILNIDATILSEIEALRKESLGAYRIKNPNIPKEAGHISFWIRKLKPVSHAQESVNRYLAINEEIGLLVGLSLCCRFHNTHMLRPPPRVMHDWVTSMRYNSHSPHSTAITFELLVQ
ncbi:MAG: hypothetical protein HQL07_18680 [Nitrospirae bacterium]|nr:hypothetical protein [Magnetococcales bacterium]